MNVEKAKELIHYDPIAGIAINRRTGKVNQRTVMLDGKKEYLNRLLYEMSYGPLGTGTVIFKDGNRDNFKLDNLVLDANKTAVVTRKASEYREHLGVREKTCTQCGSWKSLECFDRRKDTQQLRGECRDCVKVRKTDYYAKEHAQRQRRHATYQANYGVGHDVYDALLVEQGGVCAICSESDPGGNTGRFKFFSIDHCHDSGKVRGLLCNHCNRGIGFLKDSPVLLGKAIDYLNRTGTTA